MRMLLCLLLFASSVAVAADQPIAPAAVAPPPAAMANAEQRNTVQVLSLIQNSAAKNNAEASAQTLTLTLPPSQTCYKLRSYFMRRVRPNSDATRPQRMLDCTPSSFVHLLPYPGPQAPKPQ